MEELKKSKGDTNGGIRDKENGKIEGLCGSPFYLKLYPEVELWSANCDCI